MKACPLPFDHPSEAQQLNGLGPKLCDRLTEKLKAHCQEQELPMPEMPHKGQKRGAAGDGTETARPVKKPSKARPYVPALRSGPYAIIRALSTLKEDSAQGMTKVEIIAEGQQHCDSSFSAPSDPTKFFTAWNSIKTLTEKDLVYERGRPLRKYALTEEGWEVAKRIKRAAAGDHQVIENFVAPQHPGVSGISGDLESIPNRSRVVSPAPLELTSGVDVRDQTQRSRAFAKSGFMELFSSSPPLQLPTQPTQSPPREEHARPDPRPPTTTHDFQSFTPHIIPPGAFTVHLVLDTREVRAKQDRDYIQNELTTRGVQPIMRSLELGDALWVAKLHDHSHLSRHGEEGDEIMLDWIVERKRLDDLVGSIKDGRFHEQKFRLRKSGVKNVVYIIEEIALNTGYLSKYQEAVESAIASTQVVNGYFVKKTQKLDDTIRYLARTTVMLKSVYEGKPLNVIPTRTLTPQIHLPLVEHLRQTQPLTSYQTTYAAHASLSSKSDAMTLRDVYLRMLMCTRGITGDKALEIQRTWTTPAELLEALKKCEDGLDGEKARDEMLLKRMGHMVGRRKMGKALSAKVADVWARP